jgi:hypothetical protein
MKVNNEADWVTVFCSQGPLGAEVARSKLEANGIAALLRYQSIGRVLAVTVDGLGLVEVLVATADEAHARELLQVSDDNCGDREILPEGD